MTDRPGPDQAAGTARLRTASGLPTGDLLDTTTVTFDLPTPRAVLAVGAHPDDIEFGAGATLARWAAAGAEIHQLVLTDGSKGSWDPDEDLDLLVAARQKECRHAATVLSGRADAGDRVRFLGATDGELVNDNATRRQVALAIREVRPDVLLGHDPWRRYRLHPDHRAAGFVTLDALVAARDPHFFADLGVAPHRPSALLLWEADLVNHVERSDGFDAAKVDALLAHTSQLRSTMGIADGEGRDGFATRIAVQLAQHGAVAGFPAGEAFHLIDQL